jgi:hypothetical protein
MANGHVPIKLRKQMLLMRAAVERVELAQQMLDVRRAATVSAIVRNAIPGDGARSLASRVLETMLRYPFLTSGASLVAAQFKFPILRIATKWGGLATIAYKLWELWLKQHPETRRRFARIPLLRSRVHES